jgi:23S rRNA (guanine745-N1)-methyltransferase
VTDLWDEWPVQDAVADLVLSIFAPKNFPEAARVLRPGGWLAVAYPGRDHLVELRRRFGLLRQYGGNARRYADLMGRFIGPSVTTPLYDRVSFDDAVLRSVVLMGPNAHHVDPRVLDIGSGSPLVTLDINVLFARKS